MHEQNFREGMLYYLFYFVIMTYIDALNIEIP